MSLSVNYALRSVRAQQFARYNALNLTPSDDNFQSVFRAAPDATTKPAAPDKADKWSITYEDICAAALPDTKPTVGAARERNADLSAQQPHARPAGLPHADAEAGRAAAAAEQVRAHGGRHRRNASRDEGSFEEVLRPLSLPATPAHASEKGYLSGSDDISADEVSDDGSTSLEDMSDGEILTSSPPLALPRPAPKPTGDPRLSLRLYKLVSRSAIRSTTALKCSEDTGVQMHVLL